MQKNVAGQKWAVFAFGGNGATVPGDPITGDAPQITAQLSKDGAALAALTDVNPVELGGGYYVFDATQAETNADNLTLVPASSTANVLVIGVPGSLYTTPAAFNSLTISSGAASALLADSASHGGSAFVLTGDHLIFTSTSGPGASFTGNVGTSAGIAAYGGSNGPGIFGRGGANTGSGILGQAQDGSSDTAGIEGQGTGGNAQGIRGRGNGTGAGLDCEGGINGDGWRASGQGTGYNIRIGATDFDDRVVASLSNGRTPADTQALDDDTAAVTNLAAGSNQLRPFVVGTSPSATSIPTDITGAPYTDTDHYQHRVVTINEETKKIVGSSGSPVVLTVTDFVSVPSQGDAGVIS